jgi:hypothetical protein
MLFTKTEVLAAAKRATNESVNFSMEKKAAEKLVELSAKQARASSNERWDIFMSHSLMDAGLIYGIRDQLTEMGFKVYVDWIEDPHMDRESVSKETAATLQERMQQCKSLFFATTDNHSKSKWMPWECGFFDGFDGHVAILPIVDHPTTSYRGQEYLGLYPYAGKHPTLFAGKSALGIYHDSAKRESYPTWVARSIRRRSVAINFDSPLSELRPGMLRRYL